MWWNLLTRIPTVEAGLTISGGSLEQGQRSQLSFILGQTEVCAV